AATLFRPQAAFDLAMRLRTPEGAPMGEVFSYISGLYFRGKLAYARAFERPTDGLPGSFVITTARSLIPPDTPMTLADLTEFATTPIDRENSAYRRALTADADLLARRLPARAQVVLLGSIATSKYVEILLDVFGDALCFPEPFVGMGDMQRGALLLRAAAAGVELPYVAAAGAVRSLAGGRMRAR